MKMKHLFCLLIFVLGTSCEKYDDECNSKYPDGQVNELEKLLVEIRQDDEKMLEFSYDNLNRITNRIYYVNDVKYISQLYIYDSVGELDSILTEYDSYTQTEKFIYGPDKKIYSAIENDGDDEIIKEFNYDQCRIEKVMSKGTSWYTKYRYDIRGNTTEVIDYYDDQVVNRAKYRYDNKTNPLKYQVTDPYLIQNNNVTYMYLERLGEWNPLEVFMSYEYDDDGFPLKESRTMGQSTNSVTYYYRYE